MFDRGASCRVAWRGAAWRAAVLCFAAHADLTHGARCDAVAVCNGGVFCDDDGAVQAFWASYSQTGCRGEAKDSFEGASTVTVGLCSTLVAHAMAAHRHAH